MHRILLKLLAKAGINTTPLGKALKAYNWIKRIINIIKFFTMDRKGILTKDDERWLARAVASKLKFKNAFLSLVKRPLLVVLIKILDNIIIEKHVPEKFRNPLKEVIEAGKVRDKVRIARILNDKIDLSFLGMWEQQVFEGSVKFIGGYVYAYIDALEIEEGETNVDEVIDSLNSLNKEGVNNG